MGENSVSQDVDLDAARSARTTTDDSRKRCPECKSVKVHKKSKRNGNSRQFETDHHCSNCGTHFDEPLEDDSNE